MIGQRIKKYRKQKRMSQAELGAALDLSQGAISQWENGGSKPDINMIKLMAEIFGVSVLDLTGDVDASYIDSPQENTPADDRAEAKRLLEGMSEEQYQAALQYLKFLKAQK